MIITQDNRLSPALLSLPVLLERANNILATGFTISPVQHVVPSSMGNQSQVRDGYYFFLINRTIATYLRGLLTENVLSPFFTGDTFRC